MTEIPIVIDDDGTAIAQVMESKKFRQTYNMIPHSSGGNDSERESKPRRKDTHPRLKSTTRQPKHHTRPTKSVDKATRPKARPLGQTQTQVSQPRSPMPISRDAVRVCIYSASASLIERHTEQL